MPYRLLPHVARNRKVGLCLTASLSMKLSKLREIRITKLQEILIKN
jgi:hypothetical protein